MREDSSKNICNSQGQETWETHPPSPISVSHRMFLLLDIALLSLPVSNHQRSTVLINNNHYVDAILVIKDVTVLIKEVMT